MSGHPILQYSASCIIFIEEPHCGANEPVCFDRPKLLARKSGLPVFADPAEANTPAWKAQVLESQRGTLILCGALLESKVTRVAMSALMDGFDVFVLSDWCITAEPDHRRLFETRIRSKGGAILTSGQAIRELAAQCADPARAKDILSILAGH